MCGIIAVLRRPSDRIPPTAADLLPLLEGAPLALADVFVEPDPGGVLAAVAGGLELADRRLRGVAGLQALIADRSLAASVDQLCTDIFGSLATLERELDAGVGLHALADIEAWNVALIRLKDATWAIQRDRLAMAHAVSDLAGPAAGRAAIEAFMSVQAALSALNRLEVRGRDSAGLNLLVRGHGLDLAAPAVAQTLGGRDDPLFESGAACVTPDGHLSFVYKAAAEIGELGDNTRAMREAIRDDGLLHKSLAADSAELTVLGHTRWASIGIISQPNAHPMNSDEVALRRMRRRSSDQPMVDGSPTMAPFVTAVLNGDVDNFADLKVADGLRIAPEITSDAKIIPTLVSHRLAAGEDPLEAFRRTAIRFDGSVAVGASVASTPDRILLALRGSGQALYVGLSDDLYLVASEPYGLAEEADHYLRLEGDVPADPTNPSGSRGQVVELDGARAGTLAGIRRLSYDGIEQPVQAAELVTPEITTRDIDRGNAPHFLLKEIGEAPASVRKTLRGRIAERDGRLVTNLGPDVLSEELRAALRSGSLARVHVIGQGTAAIAGMSLARTLSAATATAALRVDAMLATELSGFSMRSDMSDTLVVAISQSGTTTDTNRTVDLVRSRGAKVVSIVNRRGSDLTDKSDGVLYTSDGRDVEMSVASTKAFYAQIVAGFLLAYAIANEVAGAVEEESAVLTGLRELPAAMEATISRRPAIAEAAQELAPPERHWAIVGSGSDHITAEELRIKLSELCYKSIACDTIENKKHIDLSSEPLIVVCAAGLRGSNADDVAKEVAIYRAHKAKPIVIATDGEERFSAALRVLTVPAIHPDLSFVLAAVAGHLFGYEAALAIDAQALPLREARGAIEEAVSTTSVIDGDQLLAGLSSRFEPLAARFFDGLRTGAYDGHLEASTAVRLTSLFRYATGVAPLDAYEVEYGRGGAPSVLIEDLTVALTAAIEELTRPIDAIKHQAKTVTVGISRSDEGLLEIPLVRSVLDVGAARDRIAYRSLRTLAGLDPAVAEIVGYTRYRIDGRVEDGGATITVVDRGGIARDLPLRTERNPVLRGTKHRVATEREVTVAVGRSDGRSLVIVPEVKGNQCTGLTLLHGRFRDHLPAATMRSVLEAYRGRYDALKDAVTETEPTFRDDLLGEQPVIEVLTEPVNLLADRWRSGPAQR
ncbi:MAG: SIS domain-containing protein [Actinomycetota bacterium]|nr:SIS domain-containing protein [Actinomycetota bacterium]